MKVDPIAIATACFRAVAKFHAARFMDKSALDIDWVQGREWVSGEGRELWEKDMNNLVAGWKTTREQTDSDQVQTPAV